MDIAANETPELPTFGRPNGFKISFHPTTHTLSKPWIGIENLLMLLGFVTRSPSAIGRDDRTVDQDYSYLPRHRLDNTL
jgi:hypothetical protein